MFPENTSQASFHRPDIVSKPLYVISPIFNQHRFRTRWKHYLNFEKHVIESGAKLITIEAVFGQREAVIVKPFNENHTIITVRTNHEIWIKENLINIAMQHLPEDWEYVAWMDSDIKFTRPDWVGETIQQLQHFDIVQMFKVAIDLDPNFIPYQFNRGFVYDYLSGLPIKMQFSKEIKIHNVNKKVSRINNPYCDDCPDEGTIKINYFHPGFAWAYKRKAISDLGGLFDIGILGSGDAHMAASMVGHVLDTIHPKSSEEYKKLALIWQDRALNYIKLNIGYVDGSISHFFHGDKKHRKYGSRWKILVDDQYTPSLDLKRDWNGVYQLTDHNLKLRDDSKKYFRERNDDSTDISDALGFL